MISRFDDWDWKGVPVERYKDEPGAWRSVSRRTLVSGEGMEFEVRYFELAPGGSTSLERHRHEHAVVVLRGSGRVRLGDEWHEVAPHDVVHVAAHVPHQFSNDTPEPFGILCTVDRHRDRPVSVEALEEAHAAD